MKLLTVGDSFTYGEELADISSAWPHLLGDQIGYKVTNLARPGCGNTRMVRQVVENYQEYDLIIIALSHHARIEFADDHGAYDIWPGANRSAHTHHAAWRGNLVDYISRHYNDKYTFHQQLIYTILLQSFLKFNNKRYLILESFHDKEVKHQRSSDVLAPQVDSKYYIGWPNETMMEWTYGCPQGPGGHFLNQGHKIVAEKINEHIRNLGWLS